MSIVLSILLGGAVVILVTIATGYFVAQEFAYVAVDRSRLKAAAADGDAQADRTLKITGRLSFTLSAAQLGITVTALLVGYVAEPMIGDGLAEVLTALGLPAALSPTVGVVLALLFATVVQMVFGELFPKNLAIARPEPVARWLSGSTTVYLRMFGWLVWLFDQAATRLLKLVGIEAVEDVQHAASPRDLAHIVNDSRESGDLPAELSTLLDRSLDFHDRTAEHAMTPRPQVESADADEPVSKVVTLLASGHSRFPVLGSGVDDIVGVICLRDILMLDRGQRQSTAARDAVRTPLAVPASLPLPELLHQLRGAEEEFACVVDEYGGLAGVITVEDIAEELVGEIADEHDHEGQIAAAEDGSWIVPGALHMDEVERLTAASFPPGDYETIGGLVISHLRRLPETGDSVTVELPAEIDEEDAPLRRALVTVESLDRRIPGLVRLAIDEAAHGDTAPLNGSEVIR